MRFIRRFGRIIPISENKVLQAYKGISYQLQAQSISARAQPLEQKLFSGRSTLNRENVVKRAFHKQAYLQEKSLKMFSRAGDRKNITKAWKLMAARRWNK